MADRYEVDVLTGSETEEWDRFVRGTPQFTPFATAAWQRIAAESLGNKEWRLFGCRKNGNLVAGCGGFALRKLGMDLVLPPLLTGYPGFYVTVPEASRRCAVTDEILRSVAALEEGVRKACAVAWFVHHPSLPDLRPFPWNGWETIPRYTFRMEIGPPDEMQGDFRHNLRKQIGKAEKEGVVVKRAERIDDVARMWAASYGRHDEPPPLPPETLAAWFRGLAAEGIARAYVAEGADGKVHAFRAVVLGEGDAYDWVAGSDPDLVSQGATPYLVWRILADLRGEFTSFDMMGANTPTIAAFKAGFGGALVPYMETRWYRSPAARGMMEGKKALGKIFGR
ncbi:MAG: GNAT family N-acetyltransferase [Candidatus Eisenbacteria bacterium]